MSQYPQIRFILSAWQPKQFPPDTGAEIAFAGRSNAGKSSAINAITGRKSLARTSKTPGQTQLVNFFELEPDHKLVDLPGYGFAKVPRKMQEHWRTLLSRYFETRQSLVGLVIIVDSRRALAEGDYQMLEWGRARDLMTHILLTKSDKLNRSEAAAALRQVRAEVKDRASAQLFSSVTPQSLVVEEARARLQAMYAHPGSTGRGTA
jgi:GTP-binding protein